MLRRILVVFVAISAAALLVAGCGGGHRAPFVVSRTTPPTFDVPGAPVTVKTGDAFVLRVAADPTTRHLWLVVHDYDTSVLVERGVTYEAPKQGGATTVGSQLIRLDALGRGHAILTLSSIGPGSPTPTASVTVDITVS